MRNLVLPFREGTQKQHIYDKELYNFFPYLKFPIFTRSNVLLPFTFKLLYNFNEIYVKDIDGQLVTTIDKSDIQHKIFVKNNEQYLVYSGGKINCLDLDECTFYYLEIEGYESEYFCVSNSDTLTKITFGNSKSLEDVPYGTGFQQWFWVQHGLVYPDQETFQIQRKDQYNNIEVQFSKITDQYNFEFYGVPYFLKEVFKSTEVLDTVIIESEGRVVKCLPQQAKLKEKRITGFRTIFDLEFSVLEEGTEVTNNCQDEIFTVLGGYEEVIPSDKDCISNNPILGADIDCTPSEYEGLVVTVLINY